MIESWPSLSCLSGPFCLVTKMFCYPLTFVGVQSKHVTLVYTIYIYCTFAMHEYSILLLHTIKLVVYTTGSIGNYECVVY